VYYADPTDRTKLRNLTEGRVRVDQPIDYDVFAEFLVRYRCKFFLHLLQVLHGHPIRWQRYYLSFLFEFKGVSRSGLSLLSALGVGNALTTYDIYRRNDLQNADARIRYSATFTHTSH
jgi:hypothetical protein